MMSVTELPVETQGINRNYIGLLLPASLLRPLPLPLRYQAFSISLCRSRRRSRRLFRLAAKRFPWRNSVQLGRSSRPSTRFNS